MASATLAIESNSISLHWFRVPERITFKVVLLTYRALHGSAPFLSNFIPCRTLVLAIVSTI